MFDTWHDEWTAVKRVGDLPLGGLYSATDATAGNGASTAAIAFRAVIEELRHRKSKCQRPITCNVEMLAGMKQGDPIEIEVEVSRDGGRFSFCRAVLRAISQDKEAKKTTAINLSAVFVNNDRVGKTPPFPAPPTPKKPPSFDSYVSLQETWKGIRRPNRFIESWDWKVSPEFASKFKSIVEESRKAGEDDAKLYERINAWSTSKDAIKDGFYLFHQSGRPCDPISCILWDDMFTPEGAVTMFAGTAHTKQFPMLSIVFNLNFMEEFRPEKCRGLWAKVKYKGDFGDLEEKEVVLRDEDGKAVCVGRHVIMWARPLDRGTKL